MGIGLISLANFAALRERWALGAFLSNSLDGKRPNSVVTRICKTRLSLRYCLCSPGFVVRGGELAPLHPSKPGPSSTSICCYSWAKKGFNSPQKCVAAVEAAELMGGSKSPLTPFAIMVPTAETQIFLLSFLNLNPIFRLYSSLWPKWPNQSQPSITTLLLAKASGGDRQFERGHHHLWGWILPFSPQKNLRYFTTPKHRYRACWITHF